MSSFRITPGEDTKTETEIERSLGTLLVWGQLTKREPRESSSKVGEKEAFHARVGVLSRDPRAENELPSRDGAVSYTHLMLCCRTSTPDRSGRSGSRIHFRRRQPQ